MTLLMPHCKTVDDIPRNQFIAMNCGISIIPLLSAMFYPAIGSVITLIGSVSGFFLIFVIPVVTYMKKKRLEIEHPLLAAAL